MEEELGVWSKVNVEKNREGRGEMLLFSCVKSLFPVSSLNTYLGTFEAVCYSLDSLLACCDVTVPGRAVVKCV